MRYTSAPQSSTHPLPTRAVRHRRRVGIAGLALGTFIALGACSNGAATATAPPGSEHAADIPRLADDATLFAVTDHGGMVPVDMAASVQPRLVITADGTVHRPAPMLEIFPGPVMPQVETTVLDDEDRTAVFAAIGDHLDDLIDADILHPGAADAAFSELVIRTDDEIVQMAVPVLVAEDGLVEGGSDPAHQAAIELTAEIEAIVDESAREWEAGSPDAIRITSISYDEEADPGVGPAVEFPLDGAALAPTEGFGCLDLTGDELDHFIEIIDESGADASTPWMTQGRLFQLIVRPVYTHEPACFDGAVPAPVEPSPTTAVPTPTTAKPTTSTTKPPTTQPPTTKPPTTKPPTTKPPTKAVADGGGCTPGVGALTDGRWFGFVTQAMVDAIDFDLACWFSGDNAVKAAAEDGQESPPPNDYYIRNTNPEQRTVKSGDYTSVTWYRSSGDPGSQVTTGYAEWVDANRDGVSAGVWITIKGGVVVDIAEQWTP